MERMISNRSTALPSMPLVAAGARPRRTTEHPGGQEPLLLAGSLRARARLLVDVIVEHRRRRVRCRRRVPAELIEVRRIRAVVLATVDRVAIAHHADERVVVVRD